MTVSASTTPAATPDGRRAALVSLAPDTRPLTTGGVLRAVSRLVLAVMWTLPSIPLQAALVALPGQGNVAFGAFYHRVLCRILGVKVRVVGQAAQGSKVLFLSNHSSWLDIPVLGGVLGAPFVSKADVGEWPVVGLIARLGRTVFVSRTRGRTGEEAAGMRERLAAGDSLVLFPEGTSSDGGRVLPFRSAFLGVAEMAKLVQPVSVVYDRLGGLPVARRDRAHFAWFGDMDIGSHFWRLARRSGGGVTVLLHEPVDPHAFPNRKVLTQAVERVVAEGAATLRQNRPGRPLSALG
ncbi:1-acyl-sn-glycerol-3-phosphate acyltransferase [Roseomonas aerophila]|uniref:1-acyl-sn-glycerol-3-phosphate acyltransferase n=1 Tax=Teichococcus aerophilus TaxID=1224513 RepID=A0ABR7RRD5_9PROT|nr:lysophospholipid acyltransferase family protein [Pseudoroseomonas aerophila]MBC9209180.1 1-acyl-sn-glycerol-3-phosphate acyltransferase [Pseudoroseomonas aerophila]